MKLKKLLLLFFFFALQQEIASAQQTTLDSLKRWYWGITVEPAYCYRNVYSNKNSYEVRFQDSLQMGGINFNIGFQLRKNITKNIGFETGLFYSNKGYESHYDYEITTGSPGYGFHTYDESVADNLAFSFIDIPFLIDYKIAGKRISFSLGFGPVANIFISTVSNELDDALMPDGSGFSEEVKASINYYCNKSVFSISPFYERSIFSMTDQYMELLYLYSYGIDFSYLHKF